MRPNASTPWQTLLKAAPEDQIAPVAFSADNGSLYVASSVDANSAWLLRYDLSNDQFAVVASDPTYDVGSPLIDAKDRRLAAVSFQRERTEWDVLDPAYRRDFDALHKLHAGDISFLSSTANGRRLIVAYLVDNGPVSYYSYDRNTQRGTFLFVSRPALLNYQLASMRPISYQAGDGTTIHGYPPSQSASRPSIFPWSSSCTAARGRATRGDIAVTCSGWRTAVTPCCR